MLAANLTESDINVLVDKIHKAFLVQLVGPHFAGIDAAEAAVLVMDGLLTEEESKRGALFAGVDIFMFAILMGSISAEESLADEVVYKSWLQSIKQSAQSLSKWAKNVIARIAKTRNKFRSPWRPKTIPDFLSDSEARAWLYAKQNAADLLSNATQNLKTDVRSMVLEAIEKRQSWQELEAALSKRFGVASRNWARVARTELQSAYNAGVAAYVEDKYGAEARIAFIPEPDACDVCKSLFLDANGKPRIFTVSELKMNQPGGKGTERKATISPPHPSCRCKPVAVPPGKEIDKNWDLRFSKAAEFALDVLLQSSLDAGE